VAAHCRSDVRNVSLVGFNTGFNVALSVASLDAVASTEFIRSSIEAIGIGVGPVDPVDPVGAGIDAGRTGTCIGGPPPV